MAKKKKAAKKGAKPKAAPKANTAPPAPPAGNAAAPPPPTATPYQPPGPNQFTLYQPVDDTTLESHRRELSLDQVRLGIQQKVEFLKAAGLACPDALYTDVENAIIWMQTTRDQIGEMIKRYVPLMETLRYWHVYAKEQERDTERVRHFYQRQLKTQIRAQAEKKLTVDEVDSQVRSDPVHEQWMGYQDGWMFLAMQLQQMISSLQTEMLVQASMWERKNDLPGNVPHGSVG